MTNQKSVAYIANSNMARKAELLSESAKKRRKLEQDRERLKTRVTLKGEKERWDLFKADRELKNDEEVARILLNT